LIEAKLTFADATPELLQKAAKDAANIKVIVKDKELEALIDPLTLVKACKVKGGPAPAEVKKALDKQKKKLLLTKSNISHMDKKLDEAKNRLQKTLKSFVPISSSENTKLKNSKL
jgi:hypothetical protein